MNGLIPEIEKIAAGTAGRAGDGGGRLAPRPAHTRGAGLRDDGSPRRARLRRRWRARWRTSWPWARSPSPSSPSSARRCGGSTPRASPWTRSSAATFVRAELRRQVRLHARPPACAPPAASTLRTLARAVRALCRDRLRHEERRHGRRGPADASCSSRLAAGARTHDTL